MSAFLMSLKLSLGRLQRYGLALAESIPAGKMTAMPMGMNHAAWVLGHLNLYYEDVLTMLAGDPYDGDHKDDPLFAPGATPVDDPSQYPTKEQLVAAFAVGQEAMLEAVEKADPGVADKPFDNEVLPTIGGMIIHLMIDHQWQHLGQLSALRKALRQADDNPSRTDDACT